MKITIEINTETAAFEDNRFGEVSRIMTLAKLEVMDCLNDGCGVRVPVIDANGNRAGSIEIVM
jgi:hypothetical protein